MDHRTHDSGGGRDLARANAEKACGDADWMDRSVRYTRRARCSEGTYIMPPTGALADVAVVLADWFTRHLGDGVIHMRMRHENRLFDTACQVERIPRGGYDCDVMLTLQHDPVSGQPSRWYAVFQA